VTPLTFDDYARSVVQDRLRDAKHHSLIAEARRARRIQTQPTQPFVASARVRLADGLRSLACRLDPCIVGGEAQLLIARSR